RRGGSDHSLEAYRGLSARQPVLAFTFTVLLLAQAGVPFTTGLWAKFYVISAAVASHSYVLAIIGMLAAAISAFFYLRVTVLMYMAPADDGAAAPARLSVPIGVATALPTTPAFTVMLGIALDAVLYFANKATLHF